MATHQHHHSERTRVQRKTGVQKGSHRALAQKKDDTTIMTTQETWEDDDNTLTIEGSTFISYRKKETKNRKRSGVGIILSKKATKAWKEAGAPEPVRPGEIAQATRNIGIEIHINDARGKKIKLYIISTYLPCTQYSEEEYDDTIQQLQTMIDQRPKNTIVVIGGNMNPSIKITTKEEKLFEEHDGVTGRYSKDIRNHQGERLRTFLGINKFLSTAILFEKLNHNTWSFAGAGKDERQIDHILVHQKNRKWIINCSTHDNARIISDHNAVETKFCIAKYIPEKRRYQAIIMIITQPSYHQQQHQKEDCGIYY